MNRKIRNLLILLAIILGVPRTAFGQIAQFTAPDCEFSFTYAVVGGVITAQPAPLGGTRVPASADISTQAGYDNRFKACVTWTMTYHVDGPGAVSIEIDEAPTSAGVPGTWATWPAAFVAPGTTLPLTTATNSQVSVFTYFPWVSVILNSATGSGQVQGHAYGWKPAPGQDASSTGTSVVAVTTDPCQSSGIAKSSAPINITTATTTQLVAPSGTTSVFVCGGSFTVAPSATTADTVQFITGTGATCAGSTVTKTGLYGAGEVPAANTTAPVPITLQSPGTVFSAASASGVCTITAGTAVSVQGIITYVQR